MNENTNTFNKYILLIFSLILIVTGIVIAIFTYNQTESKFKYAAAAYLEKAIDLNSYARISTEEDKDRATNSISEFYELKTEWLEAKVPKKHTNLNKDIIEFDYEITRIIESLYKFNINLYQGSVDLNNGSMNGLINFTNTSGEYTSDLMKGPEYVKIGKNLLERIDFE